MGKRILINLLSDQVMQNLIVILDKKPDEVIALTTPKFKKQVDMFQWLSKIPHKNYDFEPFDFRADLDIIRKVVKGISSEHEIIVNFTGGTKIMSLASVLSLFELNRTNISLIYLDTQNNRFLEMNMTSNGLHFEKDRPISVHVPFEYYVQLEGDKILETTVEPTKEETARKDLSGYLATRKEMNSLFNKQKQMFEKSGGRRGVVKEKHSTNFNGPKGKKTGSAKSVGTLCWDSKSFSIQTPSGNKFLFDHPDGGNYFTGAWLEEYVFQQLKDSNRFDRVERNILLSFKKGAPERIKNELDVVVTKGHKAMIIECKAGDVTQNHINKLKVLRDRLLGSHGKAVLICRFDPEQTMKEKCMDVGIEVLATTRPGMDLAQEISNILS